ncbi:MAG: DUF3299 domain-containing protein [Syntrophaceae bacterium]|nr:DUF3299 domain-containing protein [Syntrophaceae bacterium]
MRVCRLWVLLSIYLVLGQGMIYFCKAQERRDNPKSQVRIIEEKGPAGHQTIGIDESSLHKDPGKELALSFSTLMTWHYEPKTNPKPPESIKKLDGHRIRIMGFMFPLQEGKTISHFCLLRTTQTCCYGPRPEYNQYIFVEMAKPTSFYRLDPVACVGKFKVDPSPEEGFIYRLEGERCESVSEVKR